MPQLTKDIKPLVKIDQLSWYQCANYLNKNNILYTADQFKYNRKNILSSQKHITSEII